MVEQRSCQASDIFSALNGTNQPVPPPAQPSSRSKEKSGFSSSLRSEIKAAGRSTVRVCCSVPEPSVDTMQLALRDPDPGSDPAQVSLLEERFERRFAASVAESGQEEEEVDTFDPGFIQRTVDIREADSQYHKLKARLNSARQKLDSLSTEASEQNGTMNGIEGEYTWWVSKLATVGCDEDWEAEVPTWDDVYTKICRPGTAVQSKSTAAGHNPRLHEEQVTEFSSTFPARSPPCSPSTKHPTSSPRFKRVTISRRKHA
eukprot:TRINITY_DN1027_c0_g1_i3.p1 TRINITY_DN1027_c0_g1~~TRINITY_DN1027_c0_g1_i3.p1  ORF type:complete len:260 (+),score=58.40 TRINITY_DN1027_c0_g1_i3:245-1024(+)